MKSPAPHQDTLQLLPTVASLHPLHVLANFQIPQYKQSVRLSGSHILPIRHPSRDPVFSRPYRPGDPPRSIDWRAFARNDQLIVRETREQATARVGIVLEVSDTMIWPDADAITAAGKSLPTKLEIALRIALNLTHLHLRTGDLVSFYFLCEETPTWLQRVQGIQSPSDVLTFFQHLSAAQFSRACCAGLPLLKAPLAQTDLTYWLGDGLTATLDRTAVLSKTSRPRFFHMLSSLEADVAWVQEHGCYFDRSQGEREFLGRTLRNKNQYHIKLNEWMAQLRKETERLRGRYVQLSDMSSTLKYFHSLKYFASV